MTRIQQLSENYSVRSISFWRALGYAVDAILCFIAILLVVIAMDNYAIQSVTALTFTVLYFTVSETLYGKTLGKLIFKLSVVDANGNKPKLWQCIIRTLTRVFELNPMLLGPIPAFISLLITKKRQRIGDLLANTYVVRDIDLIGENVIPESDYKNI